jgi:hypothetical protein
VQFPVSFIDIGRFVAGVSRLGAMVTKRNLARLTNV